MKKIFLSSLLILSSLTAFSFAQTKQSPQSKKPETTVTKTAPTQQGLEIPFVTKTLPNGLEVIVLQDSSVPIVTAEMAVRNGSFTEPPELNGWQHWKVPQQEVQSIAESGVW